MIPRFKMFVNINFIIIIIIIETPVWSVGCDSY